jgi:hypothetical protein
VSVRAVLLLIFTALRCGRRPGRRRPGRSPRRSHGDPSWTYWINPAQAEAQAGYCYVKLEDWPRARFHLRRALQLQDDACTREGALRNALLATTYVRQDSPDLDQAIALGTQAVETLSGLVTSARCVKHVKRLTDSLDPYRRNALVRQFLEQSTDLLRTVAA